MNEREQMVERISHLWSQDISLTAIAREMKLSRNTISGIVFRQRKAGDDRCKGRPGKAPGRPGMDAFADLMADGLSIAEASEQLGITKNSGEQTFWRIRKGLGWQAV